MALETIGSGDTIATLVTTNPESGDQKSQGDDHIRNIKTAVKQTWPGIDSTVSGSAAEMAFAHKGGTVSGNAVISGSLSVSGAATIKADLSVSGSLVVGGVANITGKLTGTTAKLDSLTVSASLIMGGTGYIRVDNLVVSKTISGSVKEAAYARSASTALSANYAASAAWSYSAQYAYSALVADLAKSAMWAQSSSKADYANSAGACGSASLATTAIHAGSASSLNGVRILSIAINSDGTVASKRGEPNAATATSTIPAKYVISHGLGTTDYEYYFQGNTNSGVFSVSHAANVLSYHTGRLSDNGVGSWDTSTLAFAHKMLIVS